MAISEREIWACANEIIRQHGRAAAAHAEARAADLVANGDKAGAALWQLILHRIRDLQAEPPSERQ